MIRHICELLLAATLALFTVGAFAAPPVRSGSLLIWTGDATSDEEPLFTAAEADGVSNIESCSIMSTTGSVEVFMDLGDGTYSVDPHSLIDQGAVGNNPVTATTVLRVFVFPANAVNIQVRQAGATAATAVMACRVAK